MKIIKNGALENGEAEFILAKGKKFRIETDGEATLYRMADDGSLTGFHKSQNNVISGIGTDELYRLEIGAGGFWTCFVVGDDIRLEHLDNTPIEVDIEQPPTLIERMQDFIRSEIRNKYGAASQEVETWEDAQDFLLDDTDNLVSPYEMVDMVEEPDPLPDEPITPPVEPVVDPTPTEPDPTPVDPPA